MDKVKKYYEIEKEDSYFVLSTNDIDRHFEIVNVEGINIEHFKKNPIMFYNHNIEEPIGKWYDIRKTSDKLLAKPVFYDEDEKARRIKKLVKAGIIKGASINFTPIEIKDEPIPEELSSISHYYGLNRIRIYEKSILNEVSVVSIPANPFALAKSLYKKEIDREDLEEVFKHTDKNTIDKIGAVLNKSNLNKLKEARNLILEVIQSAKEEEDEEKNLNNDLENKKHNIKLLSWEDLVSIFQ